MKSLRAIFIDDDSKMAAELRPHYASFFEACGYQATFFDAKGEGAARKLIDAEDPHILVCDLGFDTDFSGLHTIRTLRGSYPDLFVIGTSRGDYRSEVIDSRQPSFHMFIDKKALLGGKQKYLELSQRRFLDAFKLETAVRITNLDAMTGDLLKAGPKRELVSLIRQVMFCGHEPDDLMHPDEVTLEPMAGGLSGSWVFKMISRNSKSGITCVPAVLKVSALEYAQQELDNYHRFVKWGLPYTWRVDLLGSGTTKSYGAIAYSFILSDLQKFEPLTDALRKCEDSRVAAVIDTLFSPDMRRWYGDPLIRTEKNIVERYVGRYFRGAEAQSISEAKFLEVAQKAFKAHLVGSSVMVGARKFDNPGAVLFGFPMGEYRSCICHGDLNSNNVMLAANEQTIFIDFQETGRAHVFEDFVTMEASIRLYHGEDGLHGDRLLEADMAVGDGQDIAGLGAGHKLIAQIRRLARKNFPNENFTTYYYAAAAFHYRLLRVANLTDGQTERVVAAVLANLSALMRSRGRNSC
ncbi:MAG TPA: phosphotransferase [Sphingomonas sp.]|uniref:phosphotransferase n=1 Tax=Sphingomonas sp. TaxID=28214 RepID=UPI002B7FD582|nr:phosphotransferase [Sphingomonas sp.]HMI20101.1 phosphotransferase [Sphingomonas sp.]